MTRWHATTICGMSQVVDDVSKRGALASFVGALETRFKFCGRQAGGLAGVWAGRWAGKPAGADSRREGSHNIGRVARPGRVSKLKLGSKTV